MKNWKTLKSKQILKHDRINVFEDEVELPSGEITKYVHFGEAQDSAMIIAKREDGMIFIQKEYSYPVNEWLFQLPGGAIEENETPIQGARRELQEEAGLKGDLKQLGWFYYHNRRSAGKMYVFMATNIKNCKKNHDLEEEFEDYWFSAKQIENMIKTGKIVNFSILAGWSLYKNQ